MKEELKFLFIARAVIKSLESASCTVLDDTVKFQRVQRFQRQSEVHQATIPDNFSTNERIPFD